MMAWIEQQYDLWRGLHIIAVIAWMAGMMYLPRLFAYHADAASGGELDTTFKTMEVKLLRIIINPAMVLTFVFGTLLICADGVRRGWGFLLEPWMLTKIAGIIFLASWHGFLAGSRKRFEAGTNTRSARFWKMTNELPFIAAMIMVLAVTTEFLNH
ncbi:MAG: CopD family protein [Caulobacteraceae bacterium]